MLSGSLQRTKFAAARRATKGDTSPRHLGNFVLPLLAAPKAATSKLTVQCDVVDERDVTSHGSRRPRAAVGVAQEQLWAAISLVLPAGRGDGPGSGRYLRMGAPNGGFQRPGAVEWGRGRCYAVAEVAGGGGRPGPKALGLGLAQLAGHGVFHAGEMLVYLLAAWDGTGVARGGHGQVMTVTDLAAARGVPCTPSCV